VNRNSSVLGIVTHYECEEYLPIAIASLINQTHPLSNIVVVDDASPKSPIDIVSRFPAVTLLRSSKNVGPFALIQNIVDTTNYNAYLQQDADDWSSKERLALSLDLAAMTGAGIIGTHQVNIGQREGGLHQELIEHPEDAGRAYRENAAGWYMTWGTTLCSRDLFRDLGGLATGLRLEADSDFFRRACFISKMLNVPEFCYFRRLRPQSLTQGKATGHQSAERLREREQSFMQLRANVEALKRGDPIDLQPLSRIPAVRLKHEAGPLLS